LVDIYGIYPKEIEEITGRNALDIFNMNENV